MSGKTPVENERLIILQSGTTMISATIKSNFKGMLAGPMHLFGRAFITFRISSSDIWAIIRFNWLRFLRNLLGEIWLIWFGIFFEEK